MKYYLHNKLLSSALLMIGFSFIAIQKGQAQNTQYIQYTYDAAGNPINKKNIIVGTGCPVAEEEARIVKPKDIIKEMSDAEIKKQFGITVAPNPTKDYVTVSFEIDLLDDQSSIILYNALGKVVLERKINENSIELDLSGFTSGIYYLRLKTNLVSLQYIVEKL